MFCEKQKGQILLIVVLVIIVASTIGLSIATRSIINLRTSVEEAASQKALAAAEAGMESAIQDNSSIAAQTWIANTTYSAEVISISGNSFLINGGNIIPQGEGASIWLSDYSEDPSLIYNNAWSGNLIIYWGESDDPCKNPALEMLIILGPKNNPILKRYTYDPCASRMSANNFSPPLNGPSLINNKTLYHNTPSIVVSNALLMRIIPIYGNTVGAIAGTAAFPSQGSLITSTGTSGSVTHKIRAFVGYPQAYLPYLSYGLFVAN